ncbi:MAG: hypothetical protein ABI811_01550 [Acidobacteriota bacterium]
MLANLNRKYLTPGLMVALFALNAYLCHELFSLEISQMIGSVEAVFISFSRWLADHWSDRSWFPLWISGMPVRQVYGPVLHTTVAAVSRLTQWTPQHAYHFVTAVTYCLGPVTLFWLCFKATGRRGYAFLAGLIYSLLSPSTFVVSAIRDNALGYWNARRYQTLVEFGEGPHVTALMMIPLVIWILDEAAVARKRAFLVAAPIALAILVLTNWTGTTGLVMGIAAYCLSKLGASEAAGERPLHWPTLAGIGVIAYMLAMPWIPPSLIRAVNESSQAMDTALPLVGKLKVLVPLLTAIVAAHFAAQRFQINRWYRFFLYYGLITGVVVLSYYRLDLKVVQLGHRFHLEMEMAMAGAAAFAVLWLNNKLPRWARAAALGLLVVAGVAQMIQYRSYVVLLTKSIDFTQTAEYRMSQWFAANMKDQRVLAPGTPSLWMNLYSDVPQFFGCCDQSVRTDALRHALYVIYAGHPQRKGSGELVTLWLKTYGVAAVGVPAGGGPQSPQPYTDPHQFDGVLPEAWRDGANVVYRVPGPPYSLAHVIDRARVVTRPPGNGLDIEQIVPLVNQLDHPPAAAIFRWISQHEAEITAETAPDQVLFVQETFDAGWHAYDKKTELRVVPDALGLTVVEPIEPGSHTIRLVYGSGEEDQVARAVQLAGVAFLALWAYRLTGR